MSIAEMGSPEYRQAAATVWNVVMLNAGSSKQLALPVMGSGNQLEMNEKYRYFFRKLGLDFPETFGLDYTFETEIDTERFDRLYRGLGVLPPNPRHWEYIYPEQAKRGKNKDMYRFSSSGLFPNVVLGGISLTNLKDLTTSMDVFLINTPIVDKDDLRWYLTGTKR